MKMFMGLFVFIYAGIFLISPNLAPNDDFIFLRTLQSGNPILYYSDSFPYYDAMKIGRFTPLAAMEYNFGLLLSSLPNAFHYYLAHAVQFFILTYLLYLVLQEKTKNQKMIIILIILFTLTPGFTYSWFRLQLTEKNVVFFLVIFLFAFFSYQKNRRSVWLVVGLIAANGVIYYKETGFVIFLILSFSYLVLGWKTSTIPLRIFFGSLLLSALTYVALYIFLVLPYGGAFVYGKGTLPPFEVFIKNLLNFLFVSDPFIFLIVFPLAVWRFYGLLIKKQQPIPFQDALLLSGIGFASCYFVLNLWSVYYLQPVYILSCLPVLFYVPNLYKASRVWKGLVGLTVVLVVLNSVPTGIHYLTFYKYLPVNFNHTVEFLVKNIRDNGSPQTPQKKTIFLDGVNRGSGKWFYFIISEFLRHKGLSEREFDLKSNVESENLNPDPFPLLGKIPTPFTVFERGPLPKVEKGDYLVLTPLSADPRKSINNKDYLKELKEQFDLVFETQSPLAFPLINLKVLGRYILSLGAQPGDRLLSISRHEPSFEMPDFQVYVRK